MHDSMQLKLEKLEQRINEIQELLICLLYTSDAADE